MIQIGKLKINGPALAPMAGFTDSAYRVICKEMGAGLLVSEMVSAKALCFKDKKTADLLVRCEGETPYAIQLFAGDCESASEATKILNEYNADIIDINMGCPVPKIVGSGCGSALLKNPKLAGQILNSVVKSSKTPVSAKIRLGFDKESICAVEIAKILEDNGASFITVHGRTRDQMYAPYANYEEIKRVKEAVKIPVIANGDIDSAEKYKEALSITGCDGAMIGRGALGNPFIFKEISLAAQDKPYTPPTTMERCEVMLKLARLEIQNKGERLALLELRRHLPFFFKGIRGAAAFRKRSCELSTYNELKNLLDELLEIQKEGA